MSSLIRAQEKQVFLAPNNTFSGDGRIVIGSLLSDTASAELYICTQVTPSVAWQLLTGGTGAPAGSSYVTITADGTLTAERTLTAGAGITITDGGANGPVTIASSAAAAPALYPRIFLLMGA